MTPGRYCIRISCGGLDRSRDLRLHRRSDRGKRALAVLATTTILLAWVVAACSPSEGPAGVIITNDLSSTVRLTYVVRGTETSLSSEPEWRPDPARRDEGVHPGSLRQGQPDGLFKRRRGRAVGVRCRIGSYPAAPLRRTDPGAEHVGGRAVIRVTEAGKRHRRPVRPGPVLLSPPTHETFGGATPA